jgi:hypothetical protein
MLALDLAFAFAIGCLVVRLAGPAGELGPRWAALLLELALGAGFGIGMVSVLFFVLLLLRAAFPMVMVSTEAAVLIALAGLHFAQAKRRTWKRPVSRPAGFWWYWILGGAP